MARYNYEARDRRGELIKGTLDAENTSELRFSLREKSLLMVKADILTDGEEPVAATIVVKADSHLKVRWKKFLEPRIKLQDTLVFYQQLQTTYSVGLSLVRGLDVIAEQVDHPTMKRIVKSLAIDVGEGRSLHEASTKYPELFSTVATSLIAAGEASGRMEELLGHTVQLVREQAENQAKLKSTLFYPKLVFGMIGVVFVVVFYFIIPKIAGFFEGLGAQLPLVTRIMLQISEFLLSYWYLVVGSVVAVFFGFKRWLSSRKGQEQWDRIKIKTPLVGSLLIVLETYNFCSVFALLLASGLPVTKALEVVRGTISSSLLRKDIELTGELVRNGGTLHEGLNQGGHFPKLLRSFIAIGEETGSIESALNSIGAYYKGQADYKMSNLSKALEPLLLVFIFAIVLVLALAIFMPMWQMGSAVRK